jgi:Icc-related predicted phosphoesterase
MRILAIGDLHGKVPKGLNKKFIWKSEIDLILSPGDFYGNTTGKYIIKNLFKLKRNKYGLVGTESLVEVFGKEKVIKLVRKEASQGKNVLKKLNSLGVPVVLVYGNGDQTNLSPYKENIVISKIEDIVKKLENLKLIDYNLISFGDYDVFGFGCKYSRNPSKVKDKFLKKHLIKVINEERKQLQKIKKLRKTILLVHEPPFKILDKIRDPQSVRYGQHIGDEILAQFLKEKQPLLCVCGHVHENQGKEKVGKTIVVNPGYGRNGECALIDLKDNEVNVKFLKL